jgi:lipopolysaccharide transport system ATP-binding protein
LILIFSGISQTEKPYPKSPLKNQEQNLSYTAINVQSLAKSYKIGRHQQSSKTLVESLTKAFRFKNLGWFKKRRTDADYFWALKDVSFEVKQGEVIGIIGHNGAGKSTLLKILSRITEPNSGTADIYGRVGSLLEVGTGFHRELTGRENIYLSGAILGMKKNDIERRFDEIVAFAEVEKFIDTPIKHYSSGMYLRLAFAVAAHMEPEILLIDEVLAVGDIAFQKKCLNKIDDVANAGRTVLFVSHNMGAIKELCQTALVLNNGKVDYYGSVVSGIQHYSRSVSNFQSDVSSENQTAGWTRTLVNGDRDEHYSIDNNQPFEITSDLNLPKDLVRVVMHCLIEDAECQQVAHNYIRARDIGKNDLRAGTYRIKAQVPPLWLKPGVYTVYLKLIAETQDAKQIKYLSERLLIDVADKTELFAGKVYATILPPVEWSLSAVAETNIAINGNRLELI